MHRSFPGYIFFFRQVGRIRSAHALPLFVLFFVLAVIVFNGRHVVLAEPLLLADPAFAPRERPGVLFDHDGHMELADCADCHHVYENGRNIWEYGMETRCSACHEAGNRGALGLRRAVHGQCIGCHEQQPTTGRAPVMCGGCHVRGGVEGMP